MSYYLYKLRFSTPLHIGESRLAAGLESAQLNICADTLFSALCHTILQMDGQQRLMDLVEKARAGDILFSDTFPYKGDVLYIPRPYMPSQTNREIDVARRKLIKKLSYLPLPMLDDFLGSISGKNDFDPQTIDNYFAESTVDTKVNLTGEEPSPYAVAGVSFYEGCGLYGIIKADQSQFAYLMKVMRFLGLGGIGGKISSGYGKFELEEAVPLDGTTANDSAGGQLLKQLLEKQPSDYYIALTTSLPTDEELDQALTDATYKLVRRGGFMYSTDLTTPMKKQTQYCFCAGSVFKSRFQGDVYNVAHQAPHPAYRYLKPIFLGVDLC